MSHGKARFPGPLNEGPLPEAEAFLGQRVAGDGWPQMGMVCILPGQPQNVIDLCV